MACGRAPGPRERPDWTHNFPAEPASDKIKNYAAANICGSCAMSSVITTSAFSLDQIGRYVCNTFDEARASQDPMALVDARPFDMIVIGGGSFGAVAATHMFDIDATHRHRIAVLEAGPLALPEHVQNLPSDLSPPAKGAPGTVRGQPWDSDSPMGFNREFPGLAFCLGGRSVFWGG